MRVHLRSFILGAPMPNPQWLTWSQRLAALAQNGLTFAKDPFDLERYSELRQLAADILASHSDLPLPEATRLLSLDSGYNTPKVDVRGVVFHNHQILLVQEKSDGLWTLPGGWADVGDSPADATTRELLEEANLPTRATKLLACLDRSKHPHPPLPFHVYKLFFLCEPLTPLQLPLTLEPNTETLAAHFFPENNLPPLSLTRLLPSQIALLFEHHRNPTRPTDFD